MLIFTPEDLIKILIAILIGGIIGLERELHSKAAGLRTISLITVGAAMFTILSFKFGNNSSTTQVASTVVNGVGFLGAGAILFSEGRVKGLTTATSVWVAAALGMAIGLGQYVLGIAATLVVIIILDLYTRLARWLDVKGRELRSYEISFTDRPGKAKEIEQLFAKHRMVIHMHRPMRMNNVRKDTWEVDGRAADQYALAKKLLEDKEITELHY